MADFYDSTIVGGSVDRESLALLNPRGRKITVNCVVQHLANAAAALRIRREADRHCAAGPVELILPSPVLDDGAAGA